MFYIQIDGSKTINPELPYYWAGKSKMVCLIGTTSTRSTAGTRILKHAYKNKSKEMAEKQAKKLGELLPKVVEIK